MKEKTQVQTNSGVSKAIIIAIGIILLLSACGNMTKMIFGPVIQEVSREMESEFEREISTELEREFRAMEEELEAVDKELQAVDQELNEMEIKIEVEQHDPSTFEIKLQQENAADQQTETQSEAEYGR